MFYKKVKNIGIINESRLLYRLIMRSNKTISILLTYSIYLILFKDLMII